MTNYTRTKLSNRRAGASPSVHEAYALLGLDPQADHELVQATYRILVLKYHPDKGGNAERFKELVAAYHVLQNKFQLEQRNTKQIADECDHCGNYDLLHTTPDGARCCATCLALACRRLMLPAPPITIVSCAVTIVLLCLAVACLFAECASHTTSYGLAALLLGIASLLSLAVTCATVIYTAPPRHIRRMRNRMR